MTAYKRLSYEERVRIKTYLDQGVSMAEIAKKLGRHRSTFHRELNRNPIHFAPNINQALASGLKRSKERAVQASKEWAAIQGRPEKFEETMVTGANFYKPETTSSGT